MQIPGGRWIRGVVPPAPGATPPVAQDRPRSASCESQEAPQPGRRRSGNPIRVIAHITPPGQHTLTGVSRLWQKKLNDKLKFNDIY